MILPAFRDRFLGDALESLANQTDQRFKLYIGDDCSPEPLEKTVARYRGRIALEYRRFETNLGGKDLVAHWHRCIALSRDESWIWVFSDDDIASPDCVAEFLRCVSDNPHPDVQLYRFQMEFIDTNGSKYYRPSPHPAYENLVQFASALLLDERRAWRAPDHIFSRRVYSETGGFVSLPKGIYSDYATWLKFSKKGGVGTLPGGRLSWRHHRAGTSSGMREKHRREWHRAARGFSHWLLRFAEDDDALRTLLKRHGRDWLYRQHVLFWPRLSGEETETLVRFVTNTYGITRTRTRLEWYLALVRHRLSRKLQR